MRFIINIQVFVGESERMIRMLSVFFQLALIISAQSMNAEESEAVPEISLHVVDFEASQWRVVAMVRGVGEESKAVTPRLSVTGAQDRPLTKKMRRNRHLFLGLSAQTFSPDG